MKSLTSAPPAVILLLIPVLVTPCGCAGAGAVPDRAHESAVRAADDPAREAPGAGYDDGFFIRSADGRSELVIEGLFQVVAGVFDGDREPGVDFQLKRMRPEFGGRVADALRFKLEPKFEEDGVELEEAWVGPRILGGRAQLMIGRMKAPFGLEEVRSRRHIDFPRFSILNQFSPAEDHGLFVNGRSPTERWEYGLAVYNGTGSSDSTSSKDVAARLMVHPFVGEAGDPLENLQLGVALTVGSQDETVGGDAVENALGLPVIEFAPGLRLDGTRLRAGLEAAWFRGPWFAQAEALAVVQEMSSAAADEDVSFRGVYVNVSRSLTGEAKSFSGVVPEAPFDFVTGQGRGAWVLASRLSLLAADEDLEDLGFATAGTFTDRILSVSLGLNWIPNRHAIVRTCVVYNDYADEVALDSGTSDGEVGLLVEWQSHF